MDGWRARKAQQRRSGSLDDPGAATHQRSQMRESMDKYAHDQL